MFNSLLKNKIKNAKILIFIGAPRTGSTLLGQIINYHPNCLISTEHSLMTKVVANNKHFKRELGLLYKEASKQFKTGLENDDHYGKTINRYQPKWKDMGHLANDPVFRKGDIKVVGDKKAGGTTKTYLSYSNKMIDFLNVNPNIYLLQILRHPIAAADSYMKSHKIETFDLALENIIEYSCAANELSKKVVNSNHKLYYEDLTTNVELEMRYIFSWLGVDVNDMWLSKIKEIINVTNTDKNFTKEKMLKFEQMINHKNFNYKIFERFLQ